MDDFLTVEGHSNMVVFHSNEHSQNLVDVVWRFCEDEISWLYEFAGLISPFEVCFHEFNLLGEDALGRKVPEKLLNEEILDGCGHNDKYINTSTRATK